MNDVVEEIKKRIDIVDYIGSFITLQKSGRNFKALCPFHSEKTPSFVVSPERQIWHCFGSCGEGGDIIKFLMKWENLTFFEAVSELAQKAGVKIQRVPFEDKLWLKKEKLLQLNSLAAEFFHYVLAKSKFGKKALDYLVNRSITSKTAKTFQLGYAPQSWDSLTSFLQKKKFEPEVISEGGLAIRGERGFYDRFRGRLMFPIKDVRGNVIGFSGRILEDKEGEAKYVNSPETPLYRKRESLYGIQAAKEAIKKEKNVYLVEGEFDVLTPYQKGIENIVAIKGSAVTKEQLMFLKRYTNRVTMALDADSSGEETVKRAMDEAENLEFEVEVVGFDFAKDPDEAIRKDFPAFKKALKKAIPIYDFMIETAVKKYPGEDPFSKKRIGDEIIPLVERIKNPIIQSHYIKKVAELLSVSESSILSSISKLRQKKKRQQFLRVTVKSPADEGREINIQRYVLSILFQSKDPYQTLEKLSSVIDTSDFSIPSFQKIFTEFVDQKNKNAKEFILGRFASSLPQELRSVFDELYLYASFEEDFKDENLEKLLYEVKKSSLKRQITQSMSKEEKKLTKGQEDSLKNLGLSLKEVEKKLLAL